MPISLGCLLIWPLQDVALDDVERHKIFIAIYVRDNVHRYQCNYLTTGLVFRIFRIKSNLTEVFEKPRSGTPALNVLAIRDQCHPNISKQNTLVPDTDVAPPHGAVLIT